LRVCSESLSDNGIAYISYNTYPGWKTKEIIRDAMLLRGAERATPEEKLSYALGMVDFLQQVSPEDSVMRKVLDENADKIRQSQSSYLLHEFLEPCNQPMYFKDFLAMAGEHDLGYLAEAEPNIMFLNNYEASIAEPLSKEVNQQEQLEQYLDFVTNRAFRQTLLIPKANQTKIRYNLDAKRLEQLQVAGIFFENRLASDTQQPAIYTDWRGGQIAPANALEYAFMEALSKAYPATLTFEQLAAMLESSGELAKGQDAQAATLALVETYVIRGHVRISAQGEEAMADFAINPAVEEAPDRFTWQWHPQTLRHPNGWAVSPWHDIVALAPLAQTLADVLETPVSFETLQTATLTALEKGAITLLTDGTPKAHAEDPQQAASIVHSSLMDMLLELYRHGLLTPAKP